MNKITLNPIAISIQHTRYGRGVRLRIWRIMFELSIGSPPWLKYDRWRLKPHRFRTGGQVEVHLGFLACRFRLQVIAIGPFRARRLYICPRCGFGASKDTFLYNQKHDRRWVLPHANNEVQDA